MPQSSYHLVQGLEKGLAVLRALNLRGEASAQQLGLDTGQPRPSVHRILETLCAAGYVARGKTRGAYRLTALVRLLADGYQEKDAILDIAAPILLELQALVVWPTDILTYADSEMVVRNSTHGRSPLSIHHGIVGARFPMLTTASGVVHLAFCPPREREEILRVVARKAREAEAPLQGLTGELLTQARARGYAISRHPRPARTSSIGVPVMRGDRVLACLATIWITSAMSEAEAVERLLPPLRDAALRIEQAAAGPEFEGWNVQPANSRPPPDGAPATQV